MEGHVQKWVERFSEMAHKTIEQLHQVSTFYVDDQQIKPEGREIVGEFLSRGNSSSKSCNGQRLEQVENC